MKLFTCVFLECLTDSQFEQKIYNVNTLNVKNIAFSYETYRTPCFLENWKS